MRQARVDLARMVIRAPVAGSSVTQRAVDAGQHAQAGMWLMSVVPIDSIYVDANFKGKGSCAR